MQTYPTPYADINEMLALLLTRLHAILGQHFIDMYLFIPLVVGDFAYENSCITCNLSGIDFDEPLVGE
jgi:hypothetical protein